MQQCQQQQKQRTATTATVTAATAAAAAAKAFVLHVLKCLWPQDLDRGCSAAVVQRVGVPVSTGHSWSEAVNATHADEGLKQRFALRLKFLFRRSPVLVGGA